MSVLKVVVASIIALSLVLGLALPTLADSDKPLPPTENVKAGIARGTVTEVDEENQSYFKVQTGDNEISVASVASVASIISIRVDENTRYFLLDAQRPIATLAQQLRLRSQAEVSAQVEPGIGLQERVKAAVQNQVKSRVQNQVAQTETVPLVEPQQARLRVQNQVAQTEEVTFPEPQQAILCPFGDKAEFSDIEVGDKVVVWLADGESLAKRVLIIKQVSYASVSGTITDVSSETIEITPEDGRSVTLRWNEDTVFVLNGFIAVREGQLARAVYETEHMMAEKVNVSLAGD